MLGCHLLLRLEILLLDLHLVKHLLLMVLLKQKLLGIRVIWVRLYVLSKLELIDDLHRVLEVLLLNLLKASCSVLRGRLYLFNMMFGFLVNELLVDLMKSVDRLG